MTSSSGEQRRVLVVDDERMVRELLEEVLRLDGFLPTSAADAEEAFECIDETDFGVAIIDKNLPGMSGLDVVRHAQRSQPHMKCIIYTGYPSVDSAVDALRGGAFDYFEKPLDNPILIDQVKRAWDAYATSMDRADLFRKYESLFEIVPGIVWFMTEDGVVKRINNEGAELLGYDPMELLDQPYSQLLTPDEEETAVHWAFKERRTGTRATRRQVVRLKTKPGETKVFEINATGAWDRSSEDPNKRLWGTLGVGWDVTDHFATQAQLEQARRMEALGRLAGGVAHDFNNILAIVLATAEYFKDELHSADPLQEDAHELEEVARRGTELTKQLLTLSRKGVFEPETLGLGSIVRRLDPLLRRLIPENIEFEVDCPGDLPTVRADAAQLEQVIVNLAVNGRDAMPEGGRLSVTCSRVDLDEDFTRSHGSLQPGSYVMVAVSDTGVGITPEAQEHLFEPFFTTKDLECGTGLGLATVYGIVTQAGGYVSVYSEVGVGTSMKIYLPALGEAEPEIDIVPTPSPIASGQREVTLVVEDDRQVRRQICRILAQAGYEVLDAVNGLEAIEVAKEREIQLLVTDLIMPKMNGSVLARELRATYPEMRVIYMSGYVGDVLENHNLLESGAALLQKPFGSKEMTGTARSLLDEPMG
jgi:two-component system cell cycle sensor histidine kinase/response regulator CckA